jgi:archaellum component FlaG (FlaF/FlaG flagellin family)
MHRHTGPIKAANPEGEFVIVDLTVKNIGAEPVQYFTDSQYLVIDGKQHPADVLAAVYLNPESTDYIQPGLAIDIGTPFDVPTGSIPESIVLTDISNPHAVTVDLSSTPIAP